MRAFKIIVAIVTITVLASMFYCIVSGAAFWPARSTRISATTRPVDIWTPSTWVPPAEGTGNASSGTLKFIDEYTVIDPVDIIFSPGDIHANVAVFSTDVVKKVDGVLYWSVHGMAKRLWKLEARILELELLREALCQSGVACVEKLE